MSGFDLGTRHVGDGSPCLIVAEVAQAHEGSLGMAHAYIDAVAKAGADAVKFQCHIADAESWPDEPWRVEPEWQQDETRFDYWRRMEFSPEQWWSLAAHATAQGLIFLCSPFSVEAVKILDPLVPAWKVPSGEITNKPLLGAIAETGKPAILSTGMSTEQEEQEALGFFVENDAPWAILQCTSQYPCPPERLGLNHLRQDSWSHGLSDHSGTIYAGLAAAALGCDILEVHVCFSKDQFGFDTSSSITMAMLKQLVEGVRFIEKAKTPVDKDELAKELKPMRDLFMGRHEKGGVGVKRIVAGVVGILAFCLSVGSVLFLLQLIAVLLRMDDPIGQALGMVVFSVSGAVPLTGSLYLWFKAYQLATG
jgi:N-acetylneuraminate synthase